MHSGDTSHTFINLSAFVDCLYLSLYPGILRLVSRHFFVNMAPHISSRHSSKFQGPTFLHILSAALPHPDFSHHWRNQGFLSLVPKRPLWSQISLSSWGPRRSNIFSISLSLGLWPREGSWSWGFRLSSDSVLQSLGLCAYPRLDFIFQTMPGVGQRWHNQDPKP